MSTFGRATPYTTIFLPDLVVGTASAAPRAFISRHGWRIGVARSREQLAADFVAQVGTE